MEVKFHYSEDKFSSKQLRDKLSELDGRFADGPVDYDSEVEKLREKCFVTYFSPS